MFGQIIENVNVSYSVVARFDPLENEWIELDGFGEQRDRIAVVNTNYGVVIVDGESAHTKLCQINDTSVDCEDMENNDQELTVSNGEIILFTFNHTQCPNSVNMPAMLLLSTYYDRNELKISFEEILIFSKH